MHSNFEFLLYPKIIIKQQNWLNFFSTELPFPSWVVCISILVSFPAAASLQIVTLATSSFSRKKIGDFFILQPLYTYLLLHKQQVHTYIPMVYIWYICMFCYSMLKHLILGRMRKLVSIGVEIVIFILLQWQMMR